MAERFSVRSVIREELGTGRDYRQLDFLIDMEKGFEKGATKQKPLTKEEKARQPSIVRLSERRKRKTKLETTGGQGNGQQKSKKK